MRGGSGSGAWAGGSSSILRPTGPRVQAAAVRAGRRAGWGSAVGWNGPGPSSPTFSGRARRRSEDVPQKPEEKDEDQDGADAAAAQLLGTVTCCAYANQAAHECLLWTGGCAARSRTVARVLPERKP